MATPSQKHESKDRRAEYEWRVVSRSQDQKLGTSGQRLIIVPHDKLVTLQEYLDSSGEDQVGTVEKFIANFGKGFEADVKVCQGDPPFVDAVLFEDGNEVDLLNVGDTLAGTYQFDVDGCTFVVQVVDGETFDNDTNRSRLFDLALATYVQGVQQSIEDADLCGLTYAEVRNRSAKYIAIDRCEYYLKDGKWVQGSGSVHSFVASENSTTKGLGTVRIGDVLKPATFKAPAKHARGNIFDSFNGLETNRWTGPAYL